jgi:hypothetical protein
MHHAFRLGMGLAILAFTTLAVDRASAQPAGGPAPAARPAAAAPAAPATGSGWVTAGLPFRKLAPGVMQDVIADRKAGETVERHDVTELLYQDDTFDFAKGVPFHREVWMLEFKYKPIRMIWADIPGPDARMQRKQIWYMVYEVTNPGKAFRFEPWVPGTPPPPGMTKQGQAFADPDLDEKLKIFKLYKLVSVDKPVRFAPVFSLEIHNALRKEVEGSTKLSVEQYIPIVLPAIRAREDKNREFLNSVQMPQKELRVGETVWGVATWQDVDPNNVWFSVYVEGLTNAYRFADDPAKYAAYKKGTGDGQFREIRTKVLKINFWRPGDEFTVKENQVRSGVPQLQGGPAAKPSDEWVWWKTFPPPPDRAVPPTD